MTIPYQIVQIAAYPDNWYREYTGGRLMMSDPLEAALWQEYQATKAERDRLLDRVRWLEAQQETQPPAMPAAASPDSPCGPSTSAKAD